MLEVGHFADWGGLGASCGDSERLGSSWGILWHFYGPKICFGTNTSIFRLLKIGFWSCIIYIIRNDTIEIV